MSRQLVGALLLLFVAVLAFSYIGVIPLGDSSPRPVTDDGDTNGTDVETDDPVELGQRIYTQQCQGCHTIDGSSGVGPTFQGLYGSEATFEDGTTLVVDGEHLVESIVDPQALIREGYPPVMPPFDDFSEDELAGLVAYIQSLE